VLIRNAYRLHQKPYTPAPKQLDADARTCAHPNCSERFPNKGRSPFCSVLCQKDSYKKFGPITKQAHKLTKACQDKECGKPITINARRAYCDDECKQRTYQRITAERKAARCA
jgi:hypothetical protein